MKLIKELTLNQYKFLLNKNLILFFLSVDKKSIDISINHFKFTNININKLQIIILNSILTNFSNLFSNSLIFCQTNVIHFEKIFFYDNAVKNFILGLILKKKFYFNNQIRKITSLYYLKNIINFYDILYKISYKFILKFV